MKHQTYEQRATAPKEFTKTSHDYYWLLPEEVQPFVVALENHHQKGYDDVTKLTGALSRYWNGTVLKGAGVPLIPKTNSYYALRTVRALRATQWIELITEYKIMKWEPIPPNPL